MLIYLDGKLIGDKTRPIESGQEKEIICICEVEIKGETLKKFGFSDGSKAEYKNTCFESHKGFDYLYLLVPSADLLSPESERIEIYLADKTMLLFYEGKSFIVDALCDILSSMDEEIRNPKETLHELLNLLSSHHLSCLEDIENEITDLEDALAKEESRDYVGKISMLRKSLLLLRRYYEAMLTLMEDLEENRNALFDNDDLHLLHFQSRRLDRLYHSVLNLRDYLTQVREAHQALLDIEANKVMKLFTVITSIFLPLTLLVGWYGMNLYMPEATLPHTYYIVIFSSLAIVVSLILYFKRNRWF